MPEMPLRQPGFTYSVCGPFTKNKERIQKFKEAGDSQHIYQNELDKACFQLYQNELAKACFQHDMAYGYFKDLTRRTGSDKMLCDKPFNIVKNPKYDGYQRGLVSMVYYFFDKKAFGSGIKNENMSDQQLAEDLQRQIIRKFKKRKVHSTFMENIWGADLADMQLISKFNKGFRFLLCVIDIFSKYAWVIHLKDKKGITSTNPFQEILDESNRKPNKMWVDRGNKFYNRSKKSWLGKNDIKMKENLLLLKD